MNKKQIVRNKYLSIWRIAIFTVSSCSNLDLCFNCALRIIYYMALRIIYLQSYVKGKPDSLKSRIDDKWWYFLVWRCFESRRYCKYIIQIKIYPWLKGKFSNWVLLDSYNIYSLTNLKTKTKIVFHYFASIDAFTWLIR